jgi:U32 family peptidase
MTRARPEVLAPAGDRASLEAAVAAGADAVYFGLSAWSARARASNFADDQLGETMAYLHRHGVKGYVALNTLVFDAELGAVEASIRGCAGAGVDALIVQDLGVARLARAVAPGLPLHASTQMTCTDAGSIAFARALGATRVVVARELSLAEIAAIRRDSDMELEVFVHGALCVAYSGQCLTSEAIGGRSANRGACAQACRLPYDLLVDGQPRDLDDRAYLLSPQDLEASALVPRLCELGVSALKIEGRLKGAAYVGATTRLYRQAVAAAVGEAPAPDAEARDTALQMYTRGAGPGFLTGVDHQRLVDGRTCEHRGLPVGVATGVARQRGRDYLVARLSAAVARGDGLVMDGGKAGKGEIGGRVWDVLVNGREREAAPAGADVMLWLGPDVSLAGAPPTLSPARALHRTSDPAAEARVRAQLRAPATVPLSLALRGSAGAPLIIEATSARGHRATVTSDVPLAAGAGALDEPTARAQLGRLGGTPFHLGALALDLAPDVGLPLSALNRARRALVAGLAAAAPAGLPTTAVDHRALLAQAPRWPRPEPPAGLFVLCRNLEQAQAALAAGAAGVYLDILELVGTGAAFRALASAGAGVVGLAPPRIRKPGEERIDRFLRGLAPPAMLVRGLGALHELAEARGQRPVHDRAQPGAAAAPATGADFLAVGDFSLNVTNRLTAGELLARGLDAFTPSFDLDGAQLRALLDGPLVARAEVVIHHPMPLFHMEHCLFAALLSDGHDFRDCGRPCERHQLSLRDRAGIEHPLEADVGCRNTVFHGAAQSAAELVPALQRQGVRRFRIELVRERAAEVTALVSRYRALLAGECTPQAVWQALRPEAGYGVTAGRPAGPRVVRGSLRVLT